MFKALKQKAAQRFRDLKDAIARRLHEAADRLEVGKKPKVEKSPAEEALERLEKADNAKEVLAALNGIDELLVVDKGDFAKIEALVKAADEKLQGMDPSLTAHARFYLGARLQCLTPKNDLNDEVENRRSLMENAQQWAIHFSNIRLGLTTFLTSLSIGMVTVQWDDPSTPLAISAAAVWSLAILLFAAFTFSTFSKETHEKENMEFLRKGVVTKQPMHWNRAHILAVLAPCCLFVALGASTKLTMWTWILAFVPVIFTAWGIVSSGERFWRHVRRIAPDLTLMVATMGFAYLLAHWQETKGDAGYVVTLSPAGDALVVKEAKGEDFPPGGTLFDSKSLLALKEQLEAVLTEGRSLQAAQSELALIAAEIDKLSEPSGNTPVDQLIRDLKALRTKIGKKHP